MSAFPRIRLSELCDKITDGTHHSPPNFSQGRFKYITAKNIKPWGLDLADLTYVDEPTHREIFSRCDVRKGDILYIKDGATTGIAAINTLNEEFSLLSSVGVLRPGPAIRAKYLLYALQDPATKSDMLDGIAGVAITRLTLRKLNDATVPVAPLGTQDSIVAKLEELLSDLDAGVAELKAAQKKLAQYRQSLLKAAVEGALTAEWRPQNPPTETGAQLLQRILAERRIRWEAKQLARFKEQGKAPPKDWQKKYPEPLAPDTTDLPELPQGWVWATVDQLSLEQKYGTSAKTGEHPSGVPVLRMGNIQDGQIEVSSLKYLPPSHDEFPHLLLKSGDLLFNRTNSPELVGKAAVFRSQLNPCSFASYLISVRLSSHVSPEFVNAFINSAHGRHWVKSVVVQQVGQANVNGSKLAALSVPLPPPAEQLEITEVLTTAVEVARGLGEQVTCSLKQSTAQRQNILRAAFAGQLVPQDPNDEPASALLARIRAERASQGAVKKPRRPKAKERSDA